jgi:hypothetical protein
MLMIVMQSILHAECCYACAVCHYSECCMLTVILLSVAMLSVIVPFMLSVVMRVHCFIILAVVY